MVFSNNVRLGHEIIHQLHHYIVIGGSSIKERVDKAPSLGAKAVYQYDPTTYICPRIPHSTDDQQIVLPPRFEQDARLTSCWQEKTRKRHVTGHRSCEEKKKKNPVSCGKFLGFVLARGLW